MYMKTDEVIVSIVFLVGVYVGVAKHNWRYFASIFAFSLFLTPIVMYKQLSAYNDPAMIWATAFICLGLAVYWAWKIYKSEKDAKDYIESLKDTSYYRQTGKLPTAASDNDKTIDRMMKEDNTIKLSSDKGIEGEYLVSLELRDFEGDDFKIIHNIYVPKADGTTAEIDILCITSIGLLVIENKNYSGWIFGSANDSSWTQSMYGKKTSTFYNPLLQNKSHIKALSEYLGINESMMTSIVLFSDNCELRKVPESTRESIIIQFHDLHDLIEFLLKNRPAVINSNEIKVLSDKVLTQTTPDKDTVNKHVNDAKLAKFSNLK